MLIQNVRKNRYTSPLLRLPEDVLLLLMKTMPLDHVLRLRHVSRTFMRLFHLNPEFVRHHLTRKQDEKSYVFVTRIWAAPALSFKNQATSWVRSVCDDCIALQGSNPLLPEGTAMQLLHCAGCCFPHTVTHFSPRQRLQEDSERLCRAHERDYAVCRHQSLTLNQIQWQAKAGKEMTLVCCKDHESQAFQCNDAECTGLIQPRVRIHTKEDLLYVEITILLHLPLKRLPSGKICGKNLREELLRLRAMENDRAWMPIFALAHGDVLRAFDPNMCDCVDWFGDEPQLSPRCNSGGIPNNGNGGRSSGTHRTELPLRPAAAVHWRKLAEAGYYTSTSGRCAYASHGYELKTRSFRGMVDVIPCRSSGDALVIVQKMLVGLDPTRPVHTGLRFLLDTATGCVSGANCGMEQLLFHDGIVPIWRED